MTVDKVFEKISAHMVEGLMIHSKLSNYYGFLGLKGYEECHKYHYYLENNNFVKLNEYYLYHYGKLIPDASFINPNIIPENWYNHERHDVTNETRKNAIQTGMITWVKWEQETKKLYKDMYLELHQNGEYDAALNIVRKLIKDVDEELADAKQIWLKKEIMEYDINDIILEQDNIYKKCKKKIKEIELC